jgi:hypothetical protein
MNKGEPTKAVKVEPPARYRVPFIRLWRFQCFSSCFLFGLRAATGTRVLVFDPFRHRQLPKRSTITTATGTTGTAKDSWRRVGLPVGSLPHVHIMLRRRMERADVR